MRNARIRGLGVVLFEALVLASCSNLETEKVRYLQRGNWYAAEKRDVLNPRAVIAQVELSRLSLTEPSNPAAGTALARSLIAAGDLARAENEIAELLKRLPHSPVVHALNGTFHASRSNAVAARSSFERALELSPGFLEALGGITYLDLMAKAPEQAIARLEAEIARKPTSAPLFALLARAYSAAGDQARTEQALRRAVSVDPRFYPGYTLLAQLYMQQRRSDDARAEFEGVVQRDPSAVGARTMVGMLLEAQGRRDDARKSYEATVNTTRTRRSRQTTSRSCTRSRG